MADPVTALLIVGGLSTLGIVSVAFNIWAYVTRDKNDPYWSREEMEKRSAINNGLVGIGAYNMFTGSVAGR